MVKSGSERLAKYKAKFDPEVVRSRFAAVSDLAKAKQEDVQDKMATKAAAVRNILNDAGIPPILTAPYQAFSNKLFSITRKFSSQVAIDLATEAYKQWKTYLGIAEDTAAPVLQAIWDLYSNVLGSAPSP